MFGRSERPALVMLHGLEDHWQSWRPLADRLADRFRCYAPDLPWHAGSEYRWGTWATAAQWIDEALALVPDVSVVVAHSLGAVALLRWLAADPSHGLGAIVLLAPFYRTQSTTIQPLEQTIVDIRSAARGAIRGRLGDRVDHIEPDVLDLMVAKMFERMGPHGLLAISDIFLSTSGADLTGNSTPIFVLAGTDDEGIRRDRADALAKDIPNTEIVLRDDLSHFCHSQQPDRVHDLIVEFLNRALPEHNSKEIR
ncbi:alpha/beta fold hydrolase [Nocardia sp. NPDC051052]|uniref:alpha/beta fold hydrolase n=1 Tax=Nocardia sp. NPDC051052 TaxID=3364322 RepID=UPI0037A56646